MNNAVLSCRICEETHPLAPVSHCAACSGPLDVRYISNGNGSLLTDLQELSSDRALLPHRETGASGCVSSQIRQLRTALFTSPPL